LSILDRVQSPADLKTLSQAELTELAEDIRRSLIGVVSETGGHLAPNLGVVELTLGLHLALELPKDKIVWDVGHQCYVHKLLTGRKDKFDTLRTLDGLSGFPKRSESEYDCADTGHSSTSISIALGIAEAKERLGQDGTAVAVIGDGALTGGLAYEALNHAGHIERDLIVVLNDNEMSIDSNVGAISKYLERLRLDPTMRNRKQFWEQTMQKIPAIGQRLVQMEEKFMDMVVRLVVPGLFFEELGFKYIGPIDGHDIEAVRADIALAKETGGPVLVHCITKKGHGYTPAENHPARFHGTSPFNISDGIPKKRPTSPSYTEVFGEALVEIAESRPEIVAVTAAMAAGTGLNMFSEKYPDRFYDVGIAEGHAVTFASGLASGGLKPVVAVYSTFLQRAYDSIMHDVALSGHSVIFAVDRAGLVGEDGPTHHGAFDLSYLLSVPGMTVMSPSDENELRDMLFTAMDINGPVAIRYPRGSGPGVDKRSMQKIPLGLPRRLDENTGAKVNIVALGRMVEQAQGAAQILRANDISVSVVDARFAKPLDQRYFTDLVEDCELLVTIEENSVQGGFGSSVASLMADNDLSGSLIRCGLPDNFVPHGTVDHLFPMIGLDPTGIAALVLERLGVSSSMVEDAKKPSHLTMVR